MLSARAPSFAPPSGGLAIKVKNYLSQLIGKTIDGIIVSSGAHPCCQFILTFTDGTAIELWSNERPIEMGTQLDRSSLDEIVTNMRNRHGVKVMVWRPHHEDCEKPQEEL